MKEPLKEVPVELLKELDCFDRSSMANHPVAEATRDLIEDWKRLKEENIQQAKEIFSLEGQIEDLQYKLDELNGKTNCSP